MELEVDHEQDGSRDESPMSLTEEQSSSCSEPVVFSCELCGVTTTGRQDLLAHYRGRVHIEMVSRAEVAHRSVYVRGFAISTSLEGDLRRLFSTFGGVAKVVVVEGDRERGGSYALVEFVREEEALIALKHTEPLRLGGHNLAVRPRQVRPVNKPARRMGKMGRRQRVDVGQREEEVRKREEEGRKREEPAQEEDEDSTVALTIGGIRLTDVAVQCIAQAQSVDSQLEALSIYCRLNNSLMLAQISLACSLQTWLRATFPRCLVVPFGAPISGHGTLTSDCDLSVLTESSPVDLVLTEPTQADLVTLTGPGYYPLWPQKMPGVPELEVSSSQQLSPDGSSFSRVLEIVKSREECQQVLAIPHAKCPIIRFIYQPTSPSASMHCDLSVNNRLGPSNTRMMSSYYQQDSRMSVLVPAVRVWARAHSTRRSTLNNYALSLMLIHYLQRVTPPVLPCLQDPGSWPKDMAWIRSQGFSMTQRSSYLVDGWSCDFTTHHSLLPSSNKATAAELFCGFLHYYAEEFPCSQQAVAIHTLSPILLSKLSSSTTTPSDTPTSSNSKSQFRISSLCVQDPFEHSHNVTKNMTRSNFSHFMHSLKTSHAALSKCLAAEHIPGASRQDLLDVFNTNPSVTPSSSPPPLHTLSLPLEAIQRLLHSSPTYSSLAQQLHQLDLSSPYLYQRLGCAVVQTLADRLRVELDFTVTLEEEENMECVVPSLSPSLPSSISSSSLPCVHNVSVSCSGQLRKRQHSYGEGEEGMAEEEEKEEAGGLEAGSIKRQRVGRESVEEQLLALTHGLSGANVLNCSAVTETWIHSRRQRRQRERQFGLKHGDSKPANILPSSSSTGQLPPCLVFTLTLPNPNPTGTPGPTPSPPHTLTPHSLTLAIKLENVKFLQSFHQFFAFFKKWLLNM